MGDGMGQTALLAELERRIRSFEETGAAEHVLGPAGLPVARRLHFFAGPVAPGSGEVDVELVNALARWHWCRYRALPAGDDARDLDLAVSLFAALPPTDEAVPTAVRQYLTEQQDADSQQAAIATNMAIELMNSYRQSERLEVLTAAVASFRKAVLASDIGHAHHAVYLSNLASALALRFRRTGDFADLDESISVARRAVAATPDGTSERPAHVSNLGSALRIRYTRTGDREDLDQAIEFGRQAVDRAPAAPLHLGNLAVALTSRFRLTDDVTDLDEAVELGRRAVAAIPAGHYDRGRYLSDLGISLANRFRRRGERTDLDESISMAERAVDAVPEGHPRSGSYLSNLGCALEDRYRVAGDIADLEKAVAAGRRAVVAAPSGHPELPAFLSNLSCWKRLRHERTGNETDLREAIDSGERSVRLTPDDHPDRPYRLSNLGNAWLADFERTGDGAALDKAITAARQTIEWMSARHPDLAGMRSNLANRLLARYNRDRSAADLDEGITQIRKAVADAPPGHPERVVFASNLSNSLLGRYARTRASADLAEAISVARGVVDATADGHPDRARYLSNLALGLSWRFSAAGNAADLDEAIARGRDAVAQTPVDRPDRGGYLSNLARALTERFLRANDRADVDEAIDRARQALEAYPDDHPDRALALVALGNALVRRYQRRKDPVDLQQALECRRATVDLATASSDLRVEVAQTWGGAALAAEQHGEAAAAFAAAVALLPELAWHGLDRATREEHLARRWGLGPDAGALAIKAGRREQAVEVLEQGRSVLWGQTLRLRGDLSLLAERDPDLAAEVAAVRGALDHSAPVGSADLGTLWPERQRQAEERRTLARRWDELLARVRALRGFENFLAPTPYSTLREAAAAGPVVIVNISRLGCHALVVDGSVRAVELPDVTYERVGDHADAFAMAVDRFGAPGIAAEQRQEDNRTVLDTLEWLWSAVAKPVLDALSLSPMDAPMDAAADAPRLWWCPTGPMTRLPLHAAGIHPRAPDAPADPGATVAGRVVSSTVPTLSALLRARGRVAVSPARQLVIGVPNAAGAPELPGVGPELDLLARHVPVPKWARRLIGAAATRKSVMAALPGHSWLHLACHGVQDRDDPSRSAFLLADGSLTVADLAARHLEHADMAFLSACQTATGDVRLIDEAVHLAAAMQLIGFRHVIATLWPISDITARRVTNDVYAALTQSGGLDSADAAVALHRAIGRLRERFPTEPLVWAPYIHMGV